MVDIPISYRPSSTKTNIALEKYACRRHAIDYSIHGVVNRSSYLPLLHCDNQYLRQFGGHTSQVLPIKDPDLSFGATEAKETCMPSLSGLHYLYWSSASTETDQSVANHTHMCHGHCLARLHNTVAYLTRCLLLVLFH